APPRLPPPSLHDALPISFHLGATLERLSGARGAITAHITRDGAPLAVTSQQVCLAIGRRYTPRRTGTDAIGLEHGPLGLKVDARSEEHTSELQSRGHLVC